MSAGLYRLAFFAFAAVVGTAARAEALAGFLDPTFGARGVVTSTVVGELRDVVVQPDGRIVAAGVLRDAHTFGLVRLMPDGSFDASFGDGGVVGTAVGPLSEALRVLLQPDGKIVAVGKTYTGGIADVALCRYDPTGVLDPAFGTGGVVVADLTGGDEAAVAAVLQPDGMIVIAASGAGTDDFVVARYDASGLLDSTFGTGGVVRTDVGGTDRVVALLLQPDGKLVAVGGPDGPKIARYAADGTLDPSFGVGGIVVPAPIGRWTPGAALLQPDGRIVVGGYAAPGTFVVGRYDDDGQIDASFGAAGTTVTALGPRGVAIYDLVLQPDGKIIAVGESAVAVPGATADFTMLRYRSDGSLDADFGTGGAAITPVVNGEDFGLAGALAPGGTLVAIGVSYVVPFGSVAALRYVLECPSLPDADGDGEGDACDPCTGGSTMTATKIALRRLGPPYADETLRISGAVTVPPGFDPVVSGLRVVVRGAAGNALIDADVPGGPYDRAVRAGWTTRPGAVSYRNRNEDPAGRAPAADVRALAIRSSTSGVAKLKVKGVAGTYRVGRSDPPAKVTVVFDPPTAASGRCAEAALSGCTAAPDGRQISCR